MSYKPDQHAWMAYLYDELEAAEKARMDEYIRTNPEARQELDNYRHLRQLMGTVEDKEVIAPPLVLGESAPRIVWNTPALRVVAGIAASVLILMLAGRLTGLQAGFSGNEFRISFGPPASAPVVGTAPTAATPALSANEVQQMIDASLTQNTQTLQARWQENQHALDASIRRSLASNSGRINDLVKEASTASQQQVQDFIAQIQTENQRVVNDYFQLSATQQKDYIENLLVDFSKYLQQQRTSDLQVVQNRLHALEQNTGVFQQETEQILSSIITSVGGPNGQGNPAVAVQTNY
jgi:hypothetical protein